MRCLLIAIGLLVVPPKAFALTWDFDDGTTWGWTARESFIGSFTGSTTVYSEVEDGVWRIAPVPNGLRPAITLISPLIGEDSDLFDWVTIRLRIIHDYPTEGSFLMGWSNTEYRRLKKEAPREAIRLGFYMGDSHIYPTEWENITIDIRALEAAAEADPEAEITWQDTLFHFYFDLNLLPLDAAWDETNLKPADRPAFVEVDWIQLTGAEELLLGELQPREIAVEAGLSGMLFAEPRFSVMNQEIGGHSVHGTLGDVDGDGDDDLVVGWSVRRRGWTIAASDGLGGLVPTQEVLLPDEVYPLIVGGDLDSDGLLDLALDTSRTIELWLNRGENEFETILQLTDVGYLLGLADGDGDGDVDLLGIEDLDDRWSNVTMWINDGAAGFAHSDQFVLDTQAELGASLLAGQPEGEAVRVLWNRPCWKPVETWRLTQPWAASQPPPLFFETGEVNPCDMYLLTDLDGDGAVELIGTPERNLYLGFSVGNTYHGLALWRVDASGGVERHTLLGPQVMVPDTEGVIAHDLTGDGLLDLAVLDLNIETGPALIVLVGQRAGLPVVEGRYPLPGIGRKVLAGDVNGDGATDLVVLGRSQRGDGGASVLLNQGIPATAIAAETTTMPTAFVLGANYPNPFNPATTIPLTLPAGAEEVDLTIYNVLGQPVRRVWNGSLAAGEHRLAWDGRDTAGQPVAAGVYWYRLQVDDQTRTRKMVKIE